VKGKLPFILHYDRDSSVGKVTGYGQEDSGSIPECGRDHSLYFHE
jgi:hypothetical protein